MEENYEPVDDEEVIDALAEIVDPAELPVSATGGFGRVLPADHPEFDRTVRNASSQFKAGQTAIRKGELLVDEETLERIKAAERASNTPDDADRGAAIQVGSNLIAEIRAAALAARPRPDGMITNIQHVQVDLDGTFEVRTSDYRGVYDVKVIRPGDPIPDELDANLLRVEDVPGGKLTNAQYNRLTASQQRRWAAANPDAEEAMRLGADYQKDQDYYRKRGGL